MKITPNNLNAHDDNSQDPHASGDETRVTSGSFRTLRARLEKLRSLMKASQPPLSAYIVPSTDAHQSEHVPKHAKRRAFISGFTGSAGVAVITQKEALLWTDGRYFLQAAQELSDDWTLMKARVPGTPTVRQWLHDNLTSGDSVGVDPGVLSIKTAIEYNELLSKKNISISYDTSNLVDKVWGDAQPSAPVGKVRTLALRYTGQTAVDKLKNLREQIRKKSCGATVVSSLDEICWLLNIRGSDIEFNPVVISYAFVGQDDAYLFVDSFKLSQSVLDHCADIGVVIREYNEFIPFLQQYNANQIYLDVNSASVAILEALKRRPTEANVMKRPNVVEGSSLLALPKAIKNKVELNGIRQAHIRDGVAMVRWMSWLDQEMKAGREHTECTLATELERFRALDPLFVGPSFETISGFAANGAIIHYKPEEKTCARVHANNSMYLIDSGAQYLDGTTDITRSFFLWDAKSGKSGPSVESDQIKHIKRCWTRVMQGHIALSEAAFIEGTKGTQLDVCARLPLFRDGLDYNHGTGHGVGCHLNVHEGPQVISKRSPSDEPPLQPNMVVTDEPGYYEDGSFGIRHENVLVVKKRDTLYRFNNNSFNEFETITMCPFQSSAANAKLMTRAEIQWLNAYNERCREVLMPLLTRDEDVKVKEWLRSETQPLTDEPGA